MVFCQSFETSSSGATLVRSVTCRALSILEAFDTSHPALTLSEISRRTGDPISTCHRLLAELLSWGAVEKFGMVYTIGYRLWKIGLLAPAHANIKHVAAPYMQDVLFVTRHVVNLQVRVGRKSLLVERISGTSVGKPALQVGDTTPLQQSAGGKVLLASAPKADQAATLRDLADSGTSSAKDVEKLTAELQQIRRDSWATTHGDLKSGLHGLAVPVLSGQGDVVAALGVVMVEEEPNLGTVLPVLHLAARAIGRHWVHVRAFEDNPFPSSDSVSDPGPPSTGLHHSEKTGRGPSGRARPELSPHQFRRHHEVR